MMKFFPIGIFLLIVIGHQSSAQGSAPKQIQPTTQPTATPVPQPTAQQTAQPQFSSSDVQVLAREVDRLTVRVDSIAGVTSLLITILAVVLALGGLTSLFGFGSSIFFAFRAEGRAKRDETRAIEAQKVTLGGERDSQKRAAEVHAAFLEGSQRTLELVNQTLALAKEASERAAKVTEERARINLKILDNECKELVIEKSLRDDKALVADPKEVSNLRSLAQKVAGFESNQYVLPLDIELSPYSLFIRGLDFHLNQQFDDAFKYWRRVVVSKEKDIQIKSLAWYWIGYEYNNLGDFQQAHSNFESARDTATGVRKLEIQRLLYETRFFGNGGQSPETLILFLTNLLKSTQEQGNDEESERTSRRILATLGNIYHQAGNELLKSGKVDQSKKMYQNAKDQFEMAIQDKWAPFGLAEALYMLGEKDKAKSLFTEKVRALAVREYQDRHEPRTRVMAKTTELICCVRVPTFHHLALEIYDDVLEALGTVDERLTVFSQLQRRNVKKEKFREELALLMAPLLPNRHKSQTKTYSGPQDN